VNKKFKGSFLPRKAVSPLLRAFACWGSVPTLVTLPDTAKSKPLPHHAEDANATGASTTMHFKRRDPSSGSETSLTRINCGFKVDSVLIWFLGDLETTQPPLGYVSFWPGMRIANRR
jgi:hypothetical protein